MRPCSLLSYANFFQLKSVIKLVFVYNQNIDTLHIYCFYSQANGDGLLEGSEHFRMMLS